jgi:hypothetical protein
VETEGKWDFAITLGSILMMIVGAFKLLTGIIGLFRDEWLLLGYKGYMLVDITGMAIWWLLVGALLLFGGMAAMQGKTWGRIVGIIAASLAAISEFFMLPVTPMWSIIMLVLYIVVLVAFIQWKGKPVEPY